MVRGSSSSSGEKSAKKVHNGKPKGSKLKKVPTRSNDDHHQSGPSRATNEATVSKRELVQKLDELISTDSLVDLHTHLMGMGNADFWVTKIMEGYLLRSSSEVNYKFSDICEASQLTLGNLPTQSEWLQSMVESRLFDGSAYTLSDIPYFDPADPCLPNEFLVTMMHEEDARYPKRDGPLRSLVRNWFEFLDSNGNRPDQNAILDTYRGKFTPKFSARFKMRDVIIEQAPDVLSILTNHVLGNYSYAGANYVEFSVSTKDIMNDDKRTLMTEKVFSGDYLSRVESGPSRRNSKARVKRETTAAPNAVGVTSETAAASNVVDVARETAAAYNDVGGMRETAAAYNVVRITREVAAAYNAVGVMSETAAVPNADTIEPHLDMDVADIVTAISIDTANLERGSTVLNPPEIKEGSVGRPTKTQTQSDEAKSKPGDPTIPSVLKGTSSRPAWRKFYRDYRNKNDRQMWKFLAAFPRTRGVHLPRWDPTGGLLLYELRKPTESPIDILATLATDKAPLTQMFGEISHSHEELLDKLAAHLCEDEALSQLFPKGNTSCFDLMTKFKESYRQNFGEQTAKKPATLNQVCVVGIDCVGDEFGHPYCMFAHSEFIHLINECREIYPQFGVRIHAGEGLMRHSTVDELRYAGGAPLTAPHATFMLHVLILIKSITKVIEGIAQRTPNGHRVSVRIGHGIAFLYQPKKDGPFKTALDNFRALLRQHDIVCELNPTSNHMLLQHSFTDGSGGQAGVKNIRTLRSFFDLKLPVILCTDDDGIWDIRPCAKHGSHISVARELCDAIENGDIRTEEELAHVTRRSCAFIGEDV